jgi:hypothetical protein
MVKHLQGAGDKVGDAWSALHQQSFDQYGQPVVDGINMGVDYSGKLFDELAKLRQQQQMQQLFWGNIQKAVNDGINTVRDVHGQAQQFNPALE